MSVFVPSSRMMRGIPGCKNLCMQEGAMKKFLTAMLGLAFMAGCSSEPSKPAESEKPQPKAPEYVTGRTAFQKLYVAAHGWARDAQPYRLESQTTSDWKGKDGK